MDLLKNCSYCEEDIEDHSYLQCMQCADYVHVGCLKRPGTPGDLLGDVFFKFKCINCDEHRTELFIREKLSWVMIIVIVLHNLSVQSKGLGHHGYFHYKTHIAYFIEKHWTYLFPPTFKRRKIWIGTVSGTLSHNSPQFFLSGTEIFKSPGWWKLSINQPPKYYYDLYEDILRKRQHLKPEKCIESRSSTPDSNQSGPSKKFKSLELEVFSRSLPFMGRLPRHLKSESISSLDDLLVDDDLSLTSFLDEIPNISPSAELLPSFNSASTSLLNDDLSLWSQNMSDIDFNLNEDSVSSSNIIYSDILEDDNNQKKESSKIDKSKYSINSNEEFYPRVVQVTNYQMTDVDDNPNVIQNIKTEIESSSDEEYPFVATKSLFNVGVKKELPSKNVEKPSDEAFKNIEVMSEYEENEMHRKLNVILESEDAKGIEVPSWIRRFYRKLCIRKAKRNLMKPIFDLDNMQSDLSINTNSVNILDRYHLVCNNKLQLRGDDSFHARLVGNVQYELFESPFTCRILHPFIARNTKCIPQWVQLMCELQYTVNDEMPKRAPIDFCYVRPQHIAAVNALLQRLFWPGIDMSECLSYPDFSIVALYKKLIIGCAFLVPDVGHNEAYVSFMAVRPGWQRAGIASFMLYHLTQTCMGKDITLHVSATNPAVCLYQKFGFKIEKVILDFYDKYLPNDSIQSRHAFCLRMRR